MGVFDFTVHSKGQVCVLAASADYIIKRKSGDNYLPMVIENAKLTVGRTSTCIKVPFAGDYRIEWPDEDCCPNGNQPAFEYLELIEPFVFEQDYCVSATIGE